MKSCSSPDPDDLDAVRAAITACANDPGFRAPLLEQMKLLVDNELWHEHYLDGFFKRMLADAASFPGVISVEEWLVSRFKPFAVELDKTLYALYSFFSDRETWGHVKRKVWNALQERLHSQAMGCLAFIYKTLMWRICAYDPKRSLEAYIEVSMNMLILEWLRSKHGNGHPKRETSETDLGSKEDDAGNDGGFIALSASADADPAVQAEANDDWKKIYDFLSRELKDEKQKLLQFADIDEMPALDVARLLGYRADSERIALEIAWLLIASPFSLLAGIIVRCGIKRVANETHAGLAERIRLRAIISPLVSAKIGQFALREGVTRTEVVTSVAWLLLAAHYQEAAKAVRAAGLVPRRGEAAEQFMKRILSARTELAEVDKALREIEDEAIASQVRQKLTTLHRKCRELFESDPEIHEIAKAVLARASQRGVMAPELFHDDEPQNQHEDASSPPGTARGKRNDPGEKKQGAA